MVICVRQARCMEIQFAATPKQARTNTTRRMKVLRHKFERKEYAAEYDHNSLKAAHHMNNDASQ
jgi:hypothetical protein